jgi:hypothetical protein
VVLFKVTGFPWKNSREWSDKVAQRHIHGKLPGNSSNRYAAGLIFEVENDRQMELATRTI